LLFDRISLKSGKDRVKEKNRPKARVQRVSSGENRALQGWILPIEGNKGRRRGKTSKIWTAIIIIEVDWGEVS
jgi:hypothetical protein